MKIRTLPSLIAVALFAALVFTVRSAAQDSPTKPQHKEAHHRYKFIDLGTFGGPGSYVPQDNTGAGSNPQVLNKRGRVAGWADTSIPDPFPANCFNPDCFVSHAFRWQEGVITDLGALAPGLSSSSEWISDTGLIAGQSENGVVDPLLGVPEFRAVLWKEREIIDLGTLGGNESSAFAVNNRAQVVGVAVNSTPDPFSFWGTQLRAFLWQNGMMEDLGTLGGPDAWALFVNEHGQVAGFSFTNSIPNSTTGFPCSPGQPTQDPFLWDDGKMIDLGTFGGTCGVPNALNSRGQVVGHSGLAGDTSFHPFLWNMGVLTDLGTLGGNFGSAFWINDSGEVVGWATTSDDQSAHAFFWKDGVMTDLGTVNGQPCAFAQSFNATRQIVGVAFDCVTPGGHAWLWEEGGPIVDLNTLIPAGSNLTLELAENINDRGEITGIGSPSGCGDPFVCGHAFVLIPCDQEHADDRGCEAEGESEATAVQSRPTPAPQNPIRSSQEPLTPRERVLRMLKQMGGNRRLGAVPSK
jgi:probable HAF family extracellular repeat protein